MRRFFDKSSFCRAKALKVFRKLIEANTIPRFKYQELLQRTVDRLRDQTTNVRKHALKLFAQIIQVYGLIFNADIKKGSQFQTLDQVLNEKKQLTCDNDSLKLILE